MDHHAGLTQQLNAIGRSFEQEQQATKRKLTAALGEARQLQHQLAAARDVAHAAERRAAAAEEAVRAARAAPPPAEPEKIRRIEELEQEVRPSYCPPTCRCRCGARQSKAFAGKARQIMQNVLVCERVAGKGHIHDT